MKSDSFKEGLVSIIIPVYNTSAYIDRCLDSVTKQSYNNIEIILVDDGSTDDSYEKCLSWAKKDDRIKIITQENGGLSAARNAGLDVCKGEYIQFLDSDDKIGQDMIKKMISEIEKNNADLAACAFYNIYEDKTLKGSMKAGIIIGNDIVKSMFSPGFFLSSCNKIFKRNLLLSETGQFIKFTKGLLSEDSVWLSEILPKAKRAIYVDIPFYYWYRRSDSLTRGSGEVRLDERAMTEITAFEKVAKNCKEAGDDVYEAANKRLFVILKQKLFAAYRKKDKKLTKELNTKIKNVLKEYKPSNKVDKIVVIKFKFMRLLYRMNINAEGFALFSKRPEFVTRDSSMEELKEKIQ